jgi:hypothetical protein
VKDHFNDSLFESMGHEGSEYDNMFKKWRKTLFDGNQKNLTVLPENSVLFRHDSKVGIYQQIIITLKDPESPRLPWL